MGFAEVLAIIPGIFKFWSQVVWLVKTLQKTPVEKQAELTQAIQAEATKHAQTNRPTWD